MLPSGTKNLPTCTGLLTDKWYVQASKQFIFIYTHTHTPEPSPRCVTRFQLRLN